jgi:parallel beta-helix repeat protein
MRTTCKGLVIILSIVFLASLVTVQSAIVDAQTKTVTVPDDYPTIQAAIDAAASGDTIFVKNGYYYEHLTIPKPMKLLGQNQSQTIIDGKSAGNVLAIVGSNVTVSGFTVKGSSSNGGSGIYLSGASSGSNISGNIIVDNGIGINSDLSSYNVISKNTVSSCGGNGISLNSSMGNLVSENTVTGNSQGSGILLSGSSSNSITNNRLSGNSDGIEFSSSDATSNGLYSSNNTVSGNVVESNSFIGVAFWYSSNNLVAANKISSNTFYGMYICACSKITIQNNTVTGNGDSTGRGGIDIYGTYNSTITQNKIQNNPFDGLNVDYGSQNNAIFQNNIESNGVGIYIFNYAKSNVFYSNNLVSNSQQVSSDSSANTWDNGASGGNYWSDYAGVDANADRIGDTRYLINSVNKDNYPFIKPVSFLNPVVFAPTPTPTLSEPTLSVMTDNGSIMNLTFNGNVSVSQISNLAITTNQSEKTATISFTVTGENGATGFSNITIPISQIPFGATPTIYIDNQPVENQGYTFDSNNYYLWYTTHFSTHQVTILLTPTNPIPSVTSSDSRNSALPDLDWVQTAILIAMVAIAVAAVTAAIMVLYGKGNAKQTSPA